MHASAYGLPFGAVIELPVVRWKLVGTLRQWYTGR